MIKDIAYTELCYVLVNISLFYWILSFLVEEPNVIFLIKMLKVSQCEMFNEAVLRNGICGEKSSNKGEFKSKGNYIYWLWSFSNLVSFEEVSKEILSSIYHKR